MPYINLIQEQRLAMKQNERRARVLLVTFVAVSALSLVASGYLLLATEKFQQQTAQIQNQINEVEDQLKLAEQNRVAMRALAPRLTTLQGAQESTQRWQRLLAHLSAVTPEGLYLTQVRSQQARPEDPLEITFVGISGTQESVAEMIMLLQLSEDLEKVTLRYTDAQSGQEDQIKFELAANLIKPKEETESKVANGENKESA